MKLYFFLTLFILLFLCNSVVKAQEKPKLIESISVNVGITIFKNQFKDNYLNKHQAYIAKAFNLGLEIYNKPWDLGVDVRKSIWLGLAASSFSTDVSATASYNQIGITKYLDIFAKRTFGLNISHLWIAEYSIYNIGNNSSSSRYIFNNYWTSKSISFTGSINITKYLFTEIKFNYYYYISSYYKRQNLSIPKKGINDNRIQVSLIYKINRNNKN